MKKHNFYAGPSILSRFTIENTAKAILNLNESGLSLLEISHRSKDFVKITDDAIALFKELLSIPSRLLSPVPPGRGQHAVLHGSLQPPEQESRLP